MIAIIDYGAGNMKSVEKALIKLGADVLVTSDAETILNAEKVILPGVGAFGDAMKHLRDKNLDQVILQVVKQGTPILGICLGLQLFFESSDEAKGTEGLGILKGKVLRIPDADGLKIPHIGWNSLNLQNNGKLFHGLEDQVYVYFVHSYYLQAEEADIVKATTEYGVTIHASVEKGNIYACQFHPEKSGEVGLKILKNFIELC